MGTFCPFTGRECKASCALFAGAMCVFCAIACALTDDTTITAKEESDMAAAISAAE